MCVVFRFVLLLAETEGLSMCMGILYRSFAFLTIKNILLFFNIALK